MQEEKKLADICNINKKHRNTLGKLKFIKFIEENREDLEEQYKIFLSMGKDLHITTKANIDEFCYFIYKNKF